MTPRLNYAQIAAPASEPVTLAEARVHLRLSSSTAEDSLVQAWITAARMAVEGETGRALMPQDWELRLPHFPRFAGEIELRYPPLISLLSINTADAAGNLTLVGPSLYQVEAPAGDRASPARLRPYAGGIWPTTVYGVRDAVRIQFRAGYASASAVPAPLRAAILLLVGDFYENRQAASTVEVKANPTLDRLLNPYRTHW